MAFFMKRALITGITGQDGSYLTELLLGEGYEVYGLIMRSNDLDYCNAIHLKDQINFIYGDMTDNDSLVSAIEQSSPDEVYNLAAYSFVAASWTNPLVTARVNALGVAYLLEAIRLIQPKARFFQASTCEMFGLSRETPQNENTPFYPHSPYGVAKLYGHWITRNYRESYGMYSCSGIMFNHESERRGIEFVTRKITAAVAAIAKGRQDVLELGNLSAKRDWGHAEDYVNAMHLMLQHETADDYVIATGETHSVRDFTIRAFEEIGISLRFEGEGVEEIGVEKDSGKVRVRVNPQFFRPTEVEQLLGNPEKAEKVLGWKRRVTFDELVKRMVQNDLNIK